MICEGILQYRIRQQLDTVFGGNVVILDWDTHKTARGRPDAILLNGHKQLLVVEIERELTVRNIAHALIEQAWKGAEEWYRDASQQDIPTWYEYTFHNRYPHKGDPPDLHAELGLEPNDHRPWDRRKKCMIIVAAPVVGPGVAEEAQRAVDSYIAGVGSRMPYEASIYKVLGHTTDLTIKITGCERQIISASTELEIAPPEGPGLPIPHQHSRTELSAEFKEVGRMMPRYIPAQLVDTVEYYLDCKDNFKRLLKLMAWGEYDVDVCFEFSRWDHPDNPIKGPHCQLRIGKLPSLGTAVQKHLASQLADIADKLGCPLSDLACRQPGWPLKQYQVWKPNPTAQMSPDDIARALGKFASVVYPMVNPMIRSALD